MDQLVEEYTSGVAPWVQFIVLYFVLMWVLNTIAATLIKFSKELDVDLLSYILFVPVLAIIFTPVLFGLYFTWFHVDGWWNLLLWAYTVLAILWNVVSVSND